MGADSKTTAIVKVRRVDDARAATELVWEFFDTLRERYPEMSRTIDAYIANQRVAHQLADF